MEPLFVAEIQIYQDKILGKKWKSMVAAFFEESSMGKPRIELYQSEAKRKSQDCSRTIILEDVVALKPSKAEGGATYLKIQFKDENFVQLSSDDFSRVVDVLSTICFPKKYVTIAPSTSLDSPVENDYFEFPETYPMLKLKQMHGRETTDGFFSLVLGDSLQINGQNTAHCIPYSSLIWVGTGEHCVGFGVENMGIFEFATGDALLFVEHLRSFIRFGCNFSAPQVKTICRFNRFFNPTRLANNTSPGLSNNSTMESVDSGGVYTKIPTSADTSVSSLQLNEPEYVNKVVKNELRRNASMEMLKHKMSFLHKKKNEARTDFEECADTDFVRLPIPKSILVEQNKNNSSKNVSFQSSEMQSENNMVARHTDL